ncbi:MAG: serine hydrolase [Gemmatimonadota bacterium]
MDGNAGTRTRTPNLLRTDLWPFFILPFLSLLGLGCGETEAPDPMAELDAIVRPVIRETGQEIAVYYLDLETGDSLLVSPDLRMHAASTMKVPVMIQLYLDRDAGRISLDDSLEVTTTFASIVDGSPYTLSAGSDGDSTLYALEGQAVSYRELMDLMITRSSNLATNILIQEADAERVTGSMRTLGADSIHVLRGVEDGPAFEAGLSNTTTARDLGAIMAALARGTAASEESSREMLEILSRQHWQTKIPALLPEDVRVAHKTGRITGISHDAGVVYPPGAPPYVLVILTRGFDEGEDADSVAARISRLIFDHHLERHER